jgi:chromate transport protein ChrA
LPSAFILPAALSLWSSVARSALAQRVLSGLSASVVGLLAATFVSLVRSDFAYGIRPMLIVVFALAFVLLARAKWPSWAVVLAISVVSALYASIPYVPNAWRIISRLH